MFCQYSSLKNKPSIAVTVFALYSLPTQIHLNEHILYSLVAFKGLFNQTQFICDSPKTSLHCSVQTTHPACAVICARRGNSPFDEDSWEVNFFNYAGLIRRIKNNLAFVVWAHCVVCGTTNIVIVMSPENYIHLTISCTFHGRIAWSLQSLHVNTPHILHHWLGGLLKAPWLQFWGFLYTIKSFQLWHTLSTSWKP